MFPYNLFAYKFSPKWQQHKLVVVTNTHNKYIYIYYQFLSSFSSNCSRIFPSKCWSWFISTCEFKKIDIIIGYPTEERLRDQGNKKCLQIIFGLLKYIINYVFNKIPLKKNLQKRVFLTCM